MAVPPRKIQQFLDSLEPDIFKAFEESVAIMRARSNIKTLEAAIEALNYSDAYRAAGLSDAAWTRLTEAVRNAYSKSGQFTASTEFPSRLGFDFNIENPGARDWIAQHSSELIVAMTVAQQAAIRIAITAGFEQGRNPRSIALDVVGRINPVTGRRSGGVIGLHDQFAQYATNMRDNLTNLDPHYFTRTRRDRRFDSLVRKAIDTNTPINTKKIDQIVMSYENRLLKTRGDNIARTEALSSMNAAADQAMQQAVSDGLISADAITNIWDSSGDSVTRETHRDADGQERKQGEPFIVGGVSMMYPGDMSAPAAEVINCRCIVTRRIDFSRATN